jgi:pilus assembly protein CpaE
MERLDADMLSSVLTPVEGGVWVLQSAESPDVAEIIDANAAATIIAQLRTQFGYTVVDCEHHLTERTLAALDMADRVVLVTQLNVAALRSAQRTLELTQRLGYSDDKVAVVVNRHQGGDVVSLADAADLLGRTVFFHLPNDYRVSAVSQTKGVPVVLQDPSSRLAQSYSALAAKVVGGAVSARNGKAGQSSSKISRLLGFGRK